MSWKLTKFSGIPSFVGEEGVEPGGTGVKNLHL